MTRRGFTLLELLVVIAIIGLLVTLTIPALSKVRDLGRRTVCASNLHAISIAVVMYEGDSTYGELPTHHADPQATFDTFRMRVLVEHPPGQWNSARVNLGLLLPYIDNPEAFYCPAQKSLPLAYNPPPWSPTNTLPNRWEGLAGETEGPALRSSYAARARYGTVAEPARPWKLLNYSREVLYSDFTGVDMWEGAMGKIRAPHKGGGCNRLFGTGAVKWLTIGPINKLRAVDATEPTRAEMDAYYDLLDAPP